VKKKNRFIGKNLRDFFDSMGGMPVQTKPVRDWADSHGYEYDAFRFACDDYVYGSWQGSLYRNSRCHETPKRGDVRWATTNLGHSKPTVKKAKSEHSRKSPNTFLDRLSASRMMALQNARCPCCEGFLNKSGYHVDHIMPVCKGGPNEEWNVQLLCPGCNSRKSGKDAFEWAYTTGTQLPSYFLDVMSPPDMDEIFK